VWVGLDVRIERPGYMVLEVQQTFRTERVFAGILVIEAIGFATDLGFCRD
jgi:ABC-type nitrate/sulfonate/bicarbonate transport system permease component